MISAWLEKRQKEKALQREKEQWQAYCVQWHQAFDMHYMFAFASVKAILDGDIEEARSGRHWTA